MRITHDALSRRCGAHKVYVRVGAMSALAAAIALAGCSSGSSASSSSPSTSTPAVSVANSSASATDTTASKESITIAVGTPTLTVAYPYLTVPLAMGWFKEEGLDVKLQAAKAGAETIQLMLSGKADLGVIGTEVGIGAAVKSNAAIRNVYPVDRKNIYSFGVPVDSPIASVADLKGKTVGQPSMGSATVPYAHARYLDAGFNPGSVKELAVGTGASAIAALDKGTVAAYVGWDNMWAQLKNAGLKFRLLPDAPWQGKMYGLSVYASDSFINAHPDVIAKVGRAIAKATVFLQQNPTAGVKLFWKAFPAQAPKDPADPKALAADLEVVKSVLSSMDADSEPPTFAWGSQDASNWSFEQSYLKQGGFISEEVDVSRLFDNSFAKQYVNFDTQKVIRQAKDWTDGGT